MVEYNLPNNWPKMCLEDRIEWHRDRVEKEAPIFDALQKMRVFTCFSPEEIRERLDIVRERKSQVEKMMNFMDSPQFQVLWADLNRLISEAKAMIAERATVLNKQMRRIGFRAMSAEAERLGMLKQAVNSILDQAEEIEGEIMTLSERCGVDPVPFFLVDDVRDAK